MISSIYDLRCVELGHYEEPTQSAIEAAHFPFVQCIGKSGVHPLNGGHGNVLSLHIPSGHII